MENKHFKVMNIILDMNTGGKNPSGLFGRSHSYREDSLGGGRCFYEIVWMQAAR